ncbi:unnamed protein product, partial [marine sediment metagenome]
WMLDEFDNGKSPQTVIGVALSKYRERWGGDKVVDFQQNNKSKVELEKAGIC